MSTVSLVDYGVGNIKAFANIYKQLDIRCEVAATAAQIKSAERLVLPGVGAFDWAMARLSNSGLKDALDYQVLEKKVPVIGVCVGMQMMANSSDEGALPGLGWLDAQVVKFKASNHLDTPLPHMGWNDVIPVRRNSIVDIDQQQRFYFLHSFVFRPNAQDDILAETHYGGTFVSAVQKDNIYGTQFHPEKSHEWGISLLRNFAMVPQC